MKLARLARFSAFLVMACFCVLPQTALAQSTSPDIITGTAVVVDSDILRIGNQRVILWGIDAPEQQQFCYRDGEMWGCQGAAYRTLELLSGRGEVTCYLRGEPDPFGRRFGVCESGGQDINAEMIRAGLALAYTDQSDDYLDVQFEAIAAEAGMWAIGVEFQPPWEFRMQNSPGGFR